MTLSKLGKQNFQNLVRRKVIAKLNHKTVIKMVVMLRDKLIQGPYMPTRSICLNMYLCLQCIEFLLSFWVWNLFSSGLFFFVFYSAALGFYNCEIKIPKTSWLQHAMHCVSQSWDPESPRSNYGRIAFLWRSLSTDSRCLLLFVCVFVSFCMVSRYIRLKCILSYPS